MGFTPAPELHHHSTRDSVLCPPPDNPPCLYHPGDAPDLGSARPWMTPCLQQPDRLYPPNILRCLFFVLERLCDPLFVCDEGEAAGRGIEPIELVPVLHALPPNVDGVVFGLLPELVLDALAILGPERAEPMDGAILRLRQHTRAQNKNAEQSA